MTKLLLLSIIFATISLPSRAARLKNARLGFKKTVLWLVVFNVFYVFSLVYLVGRF